MITTHVFPDISPSLILGIDFWKGFGLLPKMISNSTSLSACHSLKTDPNIFDYSSLSNDQKEIADDVISRLKAISYESKGELGRTKLVSHKIDTGDSPPIRQRCYRLSPEKQEALSKEVDQMLALKVIEKCESPWLSPVLITPKKDGDWRFCVDSRKLNSVTRKDAYRLPFINEILDNLKDAKFLSSIDIAKAFWEIPLNEPDRDKTAFYVPGRGMYRFTVMPFGLTNAPATQQRLMDTLFTPEFENKVFCYVDDIIIISSNFEEHIKLLLKVLEKLSFANLTINFGKSQFFKNELKYLGYIVNKDGLHADPDKIRAILDYPPPTSKKQIRQFHGMCSWFRRFIPNFSSVVAPFNKLASSGKKAPKFQWTTEANESFLKLKSLLVSTPVLASPDFNLPFAVHCDASNYGIGAMLTQVHNNEESVIAYMSKSLNSLERNYSATERETFAVISALEHWRCYLDNGNQFTVYTDHAALKWFLNLSNPSGRLARWALRLSCFNFILKHKKGKDNVVPDYLSRCPTEEMVAPIALDDTLSPAQVKYNKLLTGCRNNPDQFPNYKILNEKLFRLFNTPSSLNGDFVWKEVPFPSDRENLIKRCHGEPSTPHLGIFKTFKKLSLLYFWSGMFADVTRFISGCELCLKYKHTNHSPYGLMGKPKICSRPFQCISLDLIGPLPMSRSRNQYILVVTCCFTKFCCLFPLRRAVATAIIKILENDIFLVHGVPQTIIMDNGSQFQSRQFRGLLNKYNIPFASFSPNYCPQVNPTERYNKTIITALASLVNDDHRCWDIFLPTVQSAMNNSVNSVTGFSPSFLVFGREVIPCGSLYSPTNNVDELVFLPRDVYAENIGPLSAIFDKVQTALFAAHTSNAARYNTRRTFKEFNVGDTIWRKNYVLSDAGSYFSKKLAPRFVKCKVIEKLSPLVYVLEDSNGSRGKWHVKDFKL